MTEILQFRLSGGGQGRKFQTRHVFEKGKRRAHEKRKSYQPANKSSFQGHAQNKHYKFRFRGRNFYAVKGCGRGKNYIFNGKMVIFEQVISNDQMKMEMNMNQYARFRIMSEIMAYFGDSQIKRTESAPEA
jgi:hypothetical protein